MITHDEWTWQNGPKVSPCRKVRRYGHGNKIIHTLIRKLLGHNRTCKLRAPSPQDLPASGWLRLFGNVVTRQIMGAELTVLLQDEDCEGTKRLLA
jgi:hypothetical protein